MLTFPPLENNMIQEKKTKSLIDVCEIRLGPILPLKSPDLKPSGLGLFNREIQVRTTDQQELILNLFGKSEDDLTVMFSGSIT
jgi:hypothetical protein